MIEIERVRKVYRRPQHVALDDVSLHIPAGCLFGLLGVNGAGKTTLLSVLLGLMPKDAGRIAIDGRDPGRDRRAVQRGIGFVPQDFAFYPVLTVRENLAFFAGAGGIPRRERRARIAACAEIAGLEAHLSRKAQILSGGLKRRLNLAIGLLNAPRILFLDEPVVGIDPRSRHSILESITRLKRDGITVIYTSHYLDEVQRLCDRAAIIDRGRILVEGSIDELLRDAGGRRLCLDLDQKPDARLRAALTTRFSAELIGERQCVVDTESPAETLLAVQQVLAPRGVGVLAISYGHRTLEDLFFSLVRDQDAA